MRRSHPLYGWLLVWLVWLVPMSGSAATGQQAISVGTNVHVSQSHADLVHSEVFLAADPVNPNRLLGGAMAVSDGPNIYVVFAYASFDGGATWESTLETTNYPLSGDPACAYGADGTAYFVNLASETGESFGDMVVHMSPDGGRNWRAPTIISNLSNWIDREYIVVDNTGGEYHDRVYISGSGQIDFIGGERRPALGNFSFFRSLDRGEHFIGPVSRTPFGDRAVIGPGNPVVLSDGTLVGIFPEVNDADAIMENLHLPVERSNSSIRVVFSKDGGRSLTTAVKVADTYLPIGRGPERFTLPYIPYLAVDPGGAHFKDRLYAAWPDLRSGRSEILLSFSADRGRTWSEPRVVNDDEAFDRDDPTKGPNHFLPVVAVNQGGVVGVMWYDRRENPDDLGYRVRFTASLDGGETFLPSVPVSEANVPGDRDKWGVLAMGGENGRFSIHVDGFYHSGGHTAGMAADANGIFHPFWVDNRTGVSQVWTAPVSVAGTGVPNGSEALAQLTDVTERVKIEFLRTVYDRTQNSITAQVRLINNSSETIYGPIRARIIRMDSDVGEPEILGAENGIGGVGAILDFSSTLGDNRLEAGEEGVAFELVFRLANVRPLRPGKLYLVKLEARILGKLEP